MKFVIVCLMFFAFSANAQLLEDFSDGNFTSNPITWTGDVTDFMVNGQLQLQLNATAAGTSYLSGNLVQNSLDSVEWRCYVAQNFAPSSNNYGRIYLVSDQQNLEGPLNGYYLQLGESLTGDAVELFQQNGTTATSVARCTNGAIAGNFQIGIRVTRSSNAEWKIYIDYNGGTSYVFEAAGTDATFNSSAYFGVVCTYTSGNIDNFFFDDFYTGPITVDSIPPFVTSTLVTSTSSVDVKFNEVLDATSAENELNYNADNSLGIPTTAVQDATDRSLIHLTFSGNTIVPGPVYTLTMNNLQDVNNNIVAANSTTQFLLPDTTRSSDIVINEVLFNPKTGGVDFVEVYNRSTKALDLENLQIANTDEITGEVDDAFDIIERQFIILPGEYAVITTDPAIVRSTYTSGSLNDFIDMVILPSYNDGEGGVVLLDKANIEIDRFIYNEDLQFPLLNETDGVSLERMDPDRATQDNGNWHSAAASVGFATPALKNSQYNVSASDGSEISISPDVFSPDNDGNDDVLNIHYKFDQPGYTATVKIFSANGRPVLNLVQSELLGTEEGTWSWNGIDDDNEKAAIGIYVLYIEAFRTNGDTKKIKKTCVLGAKL